MRKKERQWITLGLVILFAGIAYWAYSGGFDSGWFVDLNNQLNNNTTDNTTYQLSIEALAASVDQDTGHVLVSFNLANEEHFNISAVQVLYALNVADPTNATFTELNATENNGTYSAEIPSAFGDVVYYKVKVAYDVDKVLESDVQSITVTDTTAPTATLSIDYNATTGNATFTINASDNDAIDKVILYYVVTSDGNVTGATFQNVTLTASPYTYTLTVDSDTTDTVYPYLDVYAEIYDLSGNMVRVPANGTIQLYANETKSISG